MRSMTGFGRAETKTSYGNLHVELQSINRKHLEVFASLPKELSFLEIRCKKEIGEKVFRGKLSLKVYFTFDGGIERGIFPDSSLVKKLKEGWEKVAEEASLPKEEISLGFLVRQLEHLRLEHPIDLDEMEGKLIQTLSSAVDSLISMKEQEGRALSIDIETRTKAIQKSLKNIEELAHKNAPKVTDKLQERLSSFSELKDHEERLFREVALLVEKMDITEEITRLKAHLKSFSLVVAEKSYLLGKKMDFMIQEMMRELNTIAAKSSEFSIAKEVIDSKMELERIREQVQNIE